MRTARPLRPPYRRLLCLIAACTCCLQAGFSQPSVLAAPPTSDEATLASRLRATLTRLPHREAVVSACVIDLTSGRTVFEVNADAPMTPASTMKVFSMVAALVELGPEFAFETVLATDGRNLIVVGDGDPGFGDERIHDSRKESVYAPFDRWAERVLESGRTVFAGDLVIDETIFDDQRIHPTWEPEDLGKWYAAPVGGLNFNDNCVDITVTPRRPGELVSVSTRPETPLIQVKNNCRTGKGEPVLHHKFGSFGYEIEGKCGKAWPFGAVAFPDPGLLFTDSLRTQLAKRGIRIEGQISRQRVRHADGSLPAHLVNVDRHRTPLSDCLSRAGKNSQNLFAECLLKRAGYQHATRSVGKVPAAAGSDSGDGASARVAASQHTGLSGSLPPGSLAALPPIETADGRVQRSDRMGVGPDPAGESADQASASAPSAIAQGSWASGAAAVQQIMFAAGIDPGGLRVVDGSGLSRSNACTARQLAALLAWSNGQPFGPLLHDSLAEAGVDGSLRKRLKNLDGRVHAKTGTMRGIRTLAGYVDADTGPRFAFAILFNNYKGSSTPYKEIQDRFCRVLAEACEMDGQ